jgi:ribosome assembly protein SQT1
VIILPKFDLTDCLTSIQAYKINTLFLVPPIVINIVKNQPLCNKYDLSSVKMIFTGAAPLGKETAEAINKQYPSWAIRQGYGTTETCTVVCSSIPDDIWFGSSGSLLPGYVARVMSPEGQEITEYDEPGELLVRSPTITLGYFKNGTATRETFVELEDGRYMRTGDEVVFRKAPSGNEHIWVVDRIKELIKVKVGTPDSAQQLLPDGTILT